VTLVNYDIILFAVLLIEVEADKTGKSFNFDSV